MAPSSLAPPVTDAAYPTLEQRLAVLRLQRHIFTLDQTGLWIRGSSQSTEVAVPEAAQMLSETLPSPKLPRPLLHVTVCVCVCVLEIQVHENSFINLGVV